VHKTDTSELMQLLEPPALANERPPPARGTHEIERSQSYKDAFAAFRFQSCLTRPEVFAIITDVRAENEKILLLKPFNHVQKSTRVDDFGKLQRDATDSVAQKLKKEWPRTVTTCLRQHLRHVTKGADSASELELWEDDVVPRRLVQPRGVERRHLQEVEVETVPAVPQPDDGGPRRGVFSDLELAGVATVSVPRRPACALYSQIRSTTTPPS
jgi:hypothetical protein